MIRDLVETVTRGWRLSRTAAVLAVVGALALFPHLLAAQTATTGVVVGKVSDSLGAIVSRAEVVLTDTATTRSRTQRTNEEGQFTFVGVPPGTYQLKVTSEGFKVSIVNPVIVEVNRSVTADIILEVGELSATVEVSATVGAQLQTVDAQLGNVIDPKMLRALPILSRSTLDVLLLQPTTTPGNGASGGTVSGARSDQNTLVLDGIDVSDNLAGGQGVQFTQAPVGVGAVSELRVTVANQNAEFGRSSGGQITLASPRGTNSFRGVGYWYHQNERLNANSWQNNRTAVKKTEFEDNRGGFSAGGPLIRNKTFFFGNYEGRRSPRESSFSRTVPTASMRSGVLRFVDASGATVSYPIATSTLCGAAGNTACDPRGLGLSPTVREMYGLMPEGNDATGGDRLNTTTWRGNVSVPITFDTMTARVDHNINSQLQVMGRFSYQRDEVPQTSQLDIRDPGNVVPLRRLDRRGTSVITGLDYQINSNWMNTFRFGWIQNKNDLIGTGPFKVAERLGLGGTNSSIGSVGVDLSILNEAIDVNTQASRSQILRDRNIQFSNRTMWLKGKHTMSFGAEFRMLPFLFTHDDQSTFSTGPITALDSGSFLTIPATNRPPTCGAGLTTNCLAAGDVARWNDLYAVTLGMIDNVNIVGARDGDLQPLPFGTDLVSDTNMNYYQFYFEDTWRMRSDLTMTYGLTYSWVSPLTEKLDRIALITDLNTGEVFSAESYLRAKEEAARRGQVFNPQIGVRPLKDSSRDTLSDTDYSNLGPRVAVAWRPGFKDGWLGKMSGQRSVVRGGFGIVYDRVNTISVLLPAAFGIGFGQVLQTPAPLCNASGSPGAGCDPSAGAGNRAASAFRAGVDGNIPIPAFTGGTSPIVPAVLNGGTSYATDPERKVGRNYQFDFTIQRETPGNMIVEVGYVGRLGRDLPQGIDLTVSPYFFQDSASGQSFAQAYDAVALALRSGAAVSSLPSQAWFENQLAGLSTSAVGASCRPPAASTTLSSTQCLATLNGAQFQTNAVNTLFLAMNQYRQLALGSVPYNNLQLLAILMASHGGISNYHAMVATVRNRPWKGLQFDANYTLAKSLDQVGDVQNNLGVITTGFDRNIDYGPAQSDRRHILNAIVNYELPFGGDGTSQNWLNTLIGGWYVSGIYAAYSGLPLFVTDNNGVFGGSLANLPANGAIPLGDPNKLGAGVYDGVTGSGGIGTNSNAATGGSGLNLFADPQAAYNSFRRIELSRDGRQGRSNAFRGPGFWNLDLRLAKNTRLTRNVNWEFSVDFFNVFNHVNFGNPSLTLNNPAAFGVINGQTGSPRAIQLGSRFSF